MGVFPLRHTSSCCRPLLCWSIAFLFSAPFGSTSFRTRFVVGVRTLHVTTTTTLLASTAEKEEGSPPPQRLLVPSKKTPKLGKVVMLHGFAQNAALMKRKTKTMTKKLSQAGYDVVLLDAPHVLPALQNDEDDEDAAREHVRAWFLLNRHNPWDTTGSQNGRARPYYRLQTALQQLNQELKNNDDKVWTAMFGFSQGGVLLHVLASLAEREIPPFDRVGACVMASSLEAVHDGGDDAKDGMVFPVGSMKNDEHNKQLLTMPSFHLIGNSDTSVVPDLSLSLADRFAESTIRHHEKGHLIPQTSADCTAVVEFLNAVRTRSNA